MPHLANRLRNPVGEIKKNRIARAAIRRYSLKGIGATGANVKVSTA